METGGDFTLAVVPVAAAAATLELPAMRMRLRLRLRRRWIVVGIGVVSERHVCSEHIRAGVVRVVERNDTRHLAVVAINRRDVDAGQDIAKQEDAVDSRGAHGNVYSEHVSIRGLQVLVVRVSVIGVVVVVVVVSVVVFEFNWNNFTVLQQLVRLERPKGTSSDCTVEQNWEQCESEVFHKKIIFN